MFKRDLSQLNEAELIEVQSQLKAWRNIGFALLFVNFIVSVYLQFAQVETFAGLPYFFWIVVPFPVFVGFIFLLGLQFKRVGEELRSRGRS